MSSYVSSERDWRRDLERRVAALEAAAAPPAGPAATAAVAPDGEHPLLAAFTRLAPVGGAAIVGSVPRGGGVVRWEYGLADSTLVAQAWAERAATLAALGSPVRLRLLQLIDSGVDGSSELAARDDLGTTGQVQHHLRALVTAGWSESFARGRYRIPPTRLVPLLAALAAAQRTRQTGGNPTTQEETGMTRVRIEYAKAAVTALCALAALAVSILGRTFDVAWMVIAFSTLTWYFVVKARVFSTVAARGCGQRPRP